MVNIYKYKCPYCNFDIEVKLSQFFSLPRPKAKNWKQRFAHAVKCIKMSNRQKDWILCPFCNKELVMFSGKLYKITEVDEKLFNTIHCSFCGTLLDFRKCYKESGDGGTTFYCKKCLKEHILGWGIIIAIVLAFVMWSFVSFKMSAK